jgi:hypothetical protein
VGGKTRTTGTDGKMGTVASELFIAGSVTTDVPVVPGLGTEKIHSHRVKF